MNQQIGVSDKELAKEVREMVRLLNELLEQASSRGLTVDLSINTVYKNIHSVAVNKIIQKL